VSFVILGAYAPPSGAATGDAGPASFPLLFNLAQAAATGDAGPASFPLLFNLATPVVIDPDPDPDPDVVVDWRDHSPDLLLVLEPEGADGFILEELAVDALVFAGHTPAVVALNEEPSIASLDFTDHTPD
jgi:hypothetical protein